MKKIITILVVLVLLGGLYWFLVKDKGENNPFDKVVVDSTGDIFLLETGNDLEDEIVEEVDKSDLTGDKFVDTGNVEEVLTGKNGRSTGNTEDFTGKEVDLDIIGDTTDTSYTGGETGAYEIDEELLKLIEKRGKESQNEEELTESDIELMEKIIDGLLEDSGK